MAISKLLQTRHRGDISYSRNVRSVPNRMIALNKTLHDVMKLR